MEFCDYRVLLDFKDGTQTKGFITHVDGTKITLGSKVFSNSNVKDLKVIQLPDGKQRRKTTTSHLDESVASASKASSRSGTPKLPKKNPDWGSDVQGIKASDDFDFAANLAMFDKKSVFADFQKNDMISAQERLVGHNKVDKSKKDHEKYDNDEMVIKNDGRDKWNSIGSMTHRLSSPVAAAHSGGAATPSREQVFKFKFEDGTSVPLASPVQLLEIERAAQDAFGIDGKTTAEICAANLFKFVVTKILGGTTRLSNRRNHNLPPLVLLLIGGGQCGTKALALGRHLTNHGVRVLAYVMNEELVEAEMLHQCQLFEKCGGKVVGREFLGLLDILHNQLDTPVELIIDALQGFSSQLPDIFYTAESQATLQQVVRWVNEPRQRLKVLSLDIASGIDGGSGTVTEASLQIHSKYIVSLGLPISGLLHAYQNGTLSEDTIHFVVDTGIPNAVYWTKPHLRKFDKFWYCAEEVLQILVSKE